MNKICVFTFEYEFIGKHLKNTVYNSDYAKLKSIPDNLSPQITYIYTS